MMTIPEITSIDIAFGNIVHMPKYDDLSEEFQRMRGPACRAISMWFFKGCERTPKGGIVVDGVRWEPRDGVDGNKALAAIKAAMTSWAPKHEHKIAGCGFMLNEWFEIAA